MQWLELVTLMVEGPDLPMHGRIRQIDPEDQHFGWSSHGELPVFAGARTGASREPLVVWRDWPRVRIEEPAGRVSLITDGRRAWSFEHGEELPLESSGASVRYVVSGTTLLQRRSYENFLGTDFTTPTGPVEATSFLGREAWAVEIAPPAHKPHPLQWVIDAETGMVLQQRNDGFGSVTDWAELIVGGPYDDALFAWSGPVRTQEEQRARHEAEHEEEMARRREWFARRVTAQPLRVELTPQVTLHEWDDETGAFYASLDLHPHVAIARRPRSDEPWVPAGESEPGHRWSDDEWDWSINGWGRVDPMIISALRAQLGGG